MPTTDTPQNNNNVLPRSHTTAFGKEASKALSLGLKHHGLKNKASRELGNDSPPASLLQIGKQTKNPRAMK